MLLPRNLPPKPCAGCPEPKAPPPTQPEPTYGATRPSCMECVEKHIGAAWALMDEFNDGYPYKVLIIGHLHEAEQESAEWPDLHNMIREMRKQFQAGRTPDFAAISLKIKEVRDRSSRTQ